MNKIVKWIILLVVIKTSYIYGNDCKNSFLNNLTKDNTNSNIEQEFFKQIMLDINNYADEHKITIQKTNSHIAISYYIKQFDALESMLKNTKNTNDITNNTTMVLFYLEDLKSTLGQEENKKLLNADFLINKITETQYRMFMNAIDQYRVGTFIKDHTSFGRLAYYSPESVVDLFTKRQVELGRTSTIMMVLNPKKDPMLYKQAKKQHLKQLISWQMIWNKIRKLLSNKF